MSSAAEHCLQLSVDGCVETIGPSAATAFGSATTSLVGTPLRDLLRACETGAVDALVSGETDHATGMVRRAHSQTRAVALTAISRTPTLVFVTDVSTLAAKALDHDRFFHITSDFVCTAGLDGYFERVSPSFSHRLGFTEQEMLTTPIVEFVHPDDREHTRLEFDRLAAATTGNEHFQNRYRTQTGDFIWLQWKSRLDTETGLVYAIARDITHQQQLEEKLREARQEAEQSNSAKSGFLASMSHELRTPLNGIIGYSEMIREENPDNEQLHADLSHVLDAAHQLLGLVNGVLDLAKIESGHLELFFEPVDIEGLFQQVVSTITPMVHKTNNQFVVDLRASGTIETDRSKLQQVLLNLLSNATKFTDHGTVTLQATIMADHLHIRVSDTGIGMTARQLKKVFAPYTQLRNGQPNNYKGTGLGMPIAANLAKMLGVGLDVESEVGVGTTFTLLAPLRAIRGKDARPVTGGYVIVRENK